MAFKDNTVNQRKSLRQLAKAVTNTCLSTAGLAIKTSSSALAKAATAHRHIINGVTVLIGANTDMAALSGTVENGTFNVFVFSVDADGTLYTDMGTAGETEAAIVFPEIAEDRSILGYVRINPTGTGDFVGGTTALDAAGVAPNAVYVNTPFPFRPDLALEAVSE